MCISKLLRTISVARGEATDRLTDRFPYQYQKTDRNGRLQVSKRKVAKSKKKLVIPREISNTVIITLLFKCETTKM